MTSPTHDASINPISFRIASCPQCSRKHLVSLESLSSQIVCSCKRQFQAGEFLALASDGEIMNFYATWKCPGCSKSLLVPRFATTLPAKCACGTKFPSQKESQSIEWILEELDGAFCGNYSLLEETLLSPFRAARRYDYNVEPVGNATFLVRNPTKGTVYEVEISDHDYDQCTCDVFQAGAVACIHTEHVRLKLGRPSAASQLLNLPAFAYAWLDKSCLPPRIRIGSHGSVSQDVRRAVHSLGHITSKHHLTQLKRELERIGIPFQTLVSAQLATIVDSPISIDDAIAKKIAGEGREFLNRTLPQLHNFQSDGALFLATTQRALLLDEMGMGKTIQAIAAACLLKQFAGVKSCLIVAPKSVLKHWATEIERFTNYTSTTVEGDAHARARRYLSQSLFKLVTIDSLRNDFPNTGRHDLLIVDEVQKARDVTTKASRVLRSCDCRFFFGLSGTAIEKSLEDLYGVLRIVRPDDLETPLEFFATHLVCDGFGKVRTTLNPEYFYIRHSDRMLRRKKDDLQLDIPGIEHHEIELPLTPLQEEMAEPLLDELNAISEQLKVRYNAEDFVRRQLLVNRIVELADSTALLDPATNSSSKLNWLRGFLKKTCVEMKEKVVIFTRWTRVQNLILDVCCELGIEMQSLSGSDSTEERENAVDEFTNDNEILAFVSTDAGGLGVNLQVARFIVNFEPAWNPSTDAQRLQRLHRIGQTRTVHAYLPTTYLDQLFELATHRRKKEAAIRIDLLRRSGLSGNLPSWSELVPVIDYCRSKDVKHIPRKRPRPIE